MSKKLISYSVIPLLSISLIGCSNIDNKAKITTAISSTDKINNTKPKEDFSNKENLSKIDISNLDNTTIG